MADLNQSPALWAVYNATQAVESLGCGDAFTAAVVKCSDALQAVDAEVQRRIAAESDIATLRAQLAGVRERVEQLTRYDLGGYCEGEGGCCEVMIEAQRDGDYLDRADVLAALGLELLKQGRVTL